MKLLLAALFLCATATAWAAPPETASVTPEGPREAPETLLGRAKQAYLRGDYDRTIHQVQGLLYPKMQLSSADEPEARRILALSYFYQGLRKAAEQEFSTLLQLDEGFNLDPGLDPPNAIAFLEDIRRRNREDIEALAAQKRREQAERDREAARRRFEEEGRIKRSLKPVIIEKPIERHWFALNFVPLGVGQFQNGERKKGYLFLGSQAALGLSSLGLWSYLMLKYQNNAVKVPTDDVKRANDVSNAAVILGVLFWADVVVGIVDALTHYHPSVPIIAPAAMKGGAGLSIQGAF